MTNALRGEIELTFNDKTITCYLTMDDLATLESEGVDIMQISVKELPLLQNGEIGLHTILKKIARVLVVSSHGQLSNEQFNRVFQEKGITEILQFFSDIVTCTLGIEKKMDSLPNQPEPLPEQVAEQK